MLYVISIIGICLSMLTMVYVFVNRKGFLGELVSVKAEKDGILADQTLPLARGDQVLVTRKNGRNIPATFLGNGFGKSIVRYHQNGCTFRRTNIVRA